MENDKIQKVNDLPDSNPPPPLLFPGWIRYQRNLWAFLAAVYSASSVVVFLFGGLHLLFAFLWGALLFCASIGLTLRIMSKTVIGGRGLRVMFFLSGGKLILFAGLLFVGLAQLSLSPVALFSGAFLGLMTTSLFGFWVASRSASFY